MTTIEGVASVRPSGSRAALVYQHAADDRDAAITRGLDALLGAAIAASDDRVHDRPA
jgi:hypothetical protein